MNDFTKEELQDLHALLYGGMHDDHPVPDYLIILQDKIKSMIDNYCEHERIGQVSDVDYVNICTKCKDLTGWV